VRARGRMLRDVSFPSTGGMKVSLQALGPMSAAYLQRSSTTRHRLNSHRYADRLQRSETVKVQLYDVAARMEAAGLVVDEKPALAGRNHRTKIKAGESLLPCEMSRLS